jgi:hypothetical protein
MSSVIKDEERRNSNTHTCEVFDRSDVSRGDLLSSTQESARTTAPSYQIEQELYLIPIRHWPMRIGIVVSVWKTTAGSGLMSRLVDIPRYLC